jgi:hypothetical protein
MLLEEDVAMKKVEESRLPPRPSGEANQLAAPHPDTEQRSAADELPPFPISPPPLPWPRVFPSL